MSSASRRAGRGLAARLVVVGLCLVLGWHFLATYLWSQKPNAIRDVVGEQTLSAYMLPMFGQSWSVFAPNPGSVNQDLQVRARVRSTGGKLRETDWVSLTDHSWRTGIRHHPIPSRLYLNDFILANRYFSSAMAISEKTRDIAGGDYLGADWSGKLRGDFLDAIDQSDNPTIDTFMQYERAVNGLVSSVARARWGDDVADVQVRVLKTPVVPFAQRHDEGATTTTTHFVDGWRRAQVPEGTSMAIFERWYAKGGAR